MVFEHCSITGWDLDSDTESIGEMVLNMVEDGDNNEVDEIMHNAGLGGIGNMQEHLDPDGEAYRCLGPGSSPLCRLLSERGTQNCVETGYIGSTGYVVPLHQISIVPGHTIERIGICDTGSTKLGEQISVQCHLNNMLVEAPCGPLALSNVLQRVHNSMKDNDILPESFSVEARSGPQPDGRLMDMAPLTLGCVDNVTALRGLEINTYGARGQYVVPLDCPAKRYKVPCGLGSTLVVNNVVLMYPSVPQYLVPETRRRPLEEHKGFLCCTSSSTSAALKGLVRYTTCDVVCRCYNCGVGDEILHLINVLRPNHCNCGANANKEVIMVSGIKVVMCESCVRDLEITMSRFSSTTPHCVTLHKPLTKHDGMSVKVLSFCTGAVMRWVESRGTWIDSRSDIGCISTYRSIISPSLSLIPFIEHISPVRASLANVYLNQAICSPCNKYYPGVVLRPNYSEPPCVVSDNCDYTDKRLLDCVPGLDVFAIFVNLELTYEDAIVMSRSAASRFKYTSKTSVYLSPSRFEIPKLNEEVAPFSTAWWQNHFKGVIVQKEPGPDATIKLTVESTCLPVDGDKFTTLHGQKGVVTILDDDDMPSVQGRHAEIVIGSSSVIKRGTLSQLIEAACGMYAYKHMDPSVPHSTQTILASYAADFNVRKNVIDSILRRYEGDVRITNKQPMRKVTTYDGVSVISNVRANYGMIRVMQSCFLGSIRMSSTYECAGMYSTSVNTRSSEGGSKSLGEMECTQLMASGMTECIGEFIERSDACEVHVCRLCRCLKLVCVCPREDTEDIESAASHVDTIKMPYRSIVSIVSWKVGFDINTRLSFGR